MEDTEIQELLVKAHKMSEQAIKEGKPEKAKQITRLASVIALHFIKPEDRRKVICSTCKRQLRTGVEIEFYKNVGQCHSCDAGYSDALDQQMVYAEEGQRE